MTNEDRQLLHDMGAARRPTVGVIARWLRNVEAIIARADQAEYNVGAAQREASLRILDERNRIEGIIRREIDFALLSPKRRQSALRAIDSQVKTGRRTW